MKRNDKGHKIIQIQTPLEIGGGVKEFNLNKIIYSLSAIIFLAIGVKVGILGLYLLGALLDSVSKLHLWDQVKLSNYLLIALFVERYMTIVIKVFSSVLRGLHEIIIGED